MSYVLMKYINDEPAYYVKRHDKVQFKGWSFSISDAQTFETWSFADLAAKEVGALVMWRSE